MILSFRDKRTAAVFLGRLPKGFPPDLLTAGRRKLGYLNAATTLDDLRSPPGNRLEALRSNWAGQHSIRINDQYRVCFIRIPHAAIPPQTDALHVAGDAYDVEITDYH